MVTDQPPHHCKEEDFKKTVMNYFKQAGTKGKPAPPTNQQPDKDNPNGLPAQDIFQD